MPDGQSLAAKDHNSSCLKYSHKLVRSFLLYHPPTVSIFPLAFVGTCTGALLFPVCCLVPFLASPTLQIDADFCHFLEVPYPESHFWNILFWFYFQIMLMWCHFPEVSFLLEVSLLFSQQKCHDHKLLFLFYFLIMPNPDAEATFCFFHFFYFITKKVQLMSLNAMMARSFFFLFYQECHNIIFLKRGEGTGRGQEGTDSHFPEVFVF